VLRFRFAPAESLRLPPLQTRNRNRNTGTCLLRNTGTCFTCFKLFSAAFLLVKFSRKNSGFTRLLTRRDASLYCAPFRSDPGLPVVGSDGVPAEISARWC